MQKQLVRFVVEQMWEGVAACESKSLVTHVTRHTSHITRHTSHVTRHTSHVTRHTSHVTRHTSHVTLFKVHRLVFPEHPPDARSFPFPDFRNSFSVLLDNFDCSYAIRVRFGDEAIISRLLLLLLLLLLLPPPPLPQILLPQLIIALVKHYPGSKTVPHGYSTKTTHSLTTTPT